MNIYSVTTSYKGVANFARYHVLAENGVVAGSVVNLMLQKKIRKPVKKNGKVNQPKEQVDEVERIVDDVIIPNHIREEIKHAK